MLEHFPSILTTTALVLHWGIIVGVGVRIILKRRPTGVSLAWLILITSVPFLGVFMYLMVGELWLPHRRIKQALASKKLFVDVIESIEDRWELSDAQLPDLAQSLNAQVNLPLGLSALGGNAVRLFDSFGPCLSTMIEDIDQAQSSVSMLFYIWESAGVVTEVEEALKRACARGIKCRLLVDSAGSRRFWSSARARELSKAGVEIAEALPVGRFRFQLKRIDIRNHRKIGVIDHRIGYTGSMNMVDPAYFKVGRGVGTWIDVMARVEGPAAEVLELTMALDWAAEHRGKHRESTQELVDSIKIATQKPAAGRIATQIVPSGPDQAAQLIHEMLITLMYNARKRLVLTTPYFIPSEAMMQAIISAAHRGVRVTLVVPEKIDSKLVRHASKSYFEDLLGAGVEVFTYRDGLLHSKIVTVDDDVAMLGSVNMDKRSFSINFEISMFVYDQGFVTELRDLQQSYIEHADRIELGPWRRRPVHTRLLQNTLQLLAPIL